MKSDGETDKEVGGGTACVHNVLSGSGTGSITLWGGYLGLVGGDGPEAGGSARGLPKADNGAEGKSAEVWDMVKRGSGEGSQGSGNPVPGSVY